MAKDSFWKNQTCCQETTNKMLRFLCYHIGSGSLTLQKDCTHRIDAFEMWVYRRTLKITPRIDDKFNKEALLRMNKLNNFEGMLQVVSSNT